MTQSNTLCPLGTPPHRKGVATGRLLFLRRPKIQAGAGKRWRRQAPTNLPGHLSRQRRIKRLHSMEFKDYCKIMGVARDATQDAIKRAYRQLARKFHPDVSKDTDTEFRKIRNPAETRSWRQSGWRCAGPATT